MNNKLYSLLVAALVGGTALGSQAAVRYVTPAGTGDGSSWTAATSDLQAAIDASQAGDEVWIAAGTYKPTKLIRSNKETSKAFFLKNGVSLYGGFAGTETSKDARQGDKWNMANETILSADDEVADTWEREFFGSYRKTWKVENDEVVGTSGNSTHVLYSAETLTSTTVINGLTLTGGNANVWQVKAYGGALYALGNVQMSQCKVVENSAYFKAQSSNDSNTYGGAIYLGGTGEASIKDCYFARNYAHSSYGVSYGGAVYATNTAIEGCTFENIVSDDAGGAVALVGGSISNCTFNDTYGGSGGAIFLQDATASDLTITNCRGLQGAGIYNMGGTVSHSIIANCYADAIEFGSDMGGQGGGIYNRGKVMGSVVYNCQAFTGGGIFNYDESSYVVNSTVLNNALREGNEANPNIAENSTAENVRVMNTISDASFEASNFVKATTFAGFDESKATEVAEANWDLAEGSSYIDAGQTYDGYTEATDILGRTRVCGEAIDLGAYEYQTPVEEKPAITITFAPGTEAARIGVGGSTGTEFSIDWGNGEKEVHSQAAYYSGLIKGDAVKIYGEGILILQAANQDITSVDLSGAKDLSRIQLGQNQLTSLDVTNCTSLTGIYCEENQIATVKGLDNCNYLRVLDLHNNVIAGSIDCSKMNSLSKVDVADNQLTGLVLPKHNTLVTVDCRNNKLTELDVTNLGGVTELDCQGNQLTSLDLTGMTALEELYAYENQLTELDPSPATALTSLNAADNQLTSIDLSKNAKLEGVYLYNNQLNGLDITANPNVRWLNIGNNKIAGALNTSNQKSLSLLIADDNLITSVDLSNNPSLNQIKLSNNLLTEIDVTNQPYLSWLKVNGNQLSALNTSSNSYLYWLECGDNNIASLDLTKNTYLQWLAAENNKLADLDLSKNTGIQGLTLQGNRLELETLNRIIEGLQDVTSIEPNDNNRAWVKILNISYMPGTKDANIEVAEGKGWTVIAEYDPSAINDVKAATATATRKYVLNGQVVIEANGVKYNTAGQVIK